MRKLIILLCFCSSLYAELSFKPNTNLVSIGVGAGAEPRAFWVVMLTPTRYTQFTFSGLRDLGRNNYDNGISTFLKVGLFDHSKFYQPFIGIGYGVHVIYGGYIPDEADDDIAFHRPQFGLGSNLWFGEGRHFGVNLGIYYSLGDKDAQAKDPWKDEWNDDLQEGIWLPSLSLTYNFLKL